MIHSDNSKTIRQHEIEDRYHFGMQTFCPPQSVEEFSQMNYGQRVATCKYYPDLYYEFLRQERQNTQNGFSKRK